jgi:hypothetical protein
MGLLALVGPSVFARMRAPDCSRWGDETHQATPDRVYHVRSYSGANQKSTAGPRGFRNAPGCLLKAARGPSPSVSLGEFAIRVRFSFVYWPKDRRAACSRNLRYEKTVFLDNRVTQVFLTCQHRPVRLCTVLTTCWSAGPHHQRTSPAGSRVDWADKSSWPLFPLDCRPGLSAGLCLHCFAK